MKTQWQKRTDQCKQTLSLCLDERPWKTSRQPNLFETSLKHRIIAFLPHTFHVTPQVLDCVQVWVFFQTSPVLHPLFSKIPKNHSRSENTVLLEYKSVIRLFIHVTLGKFSNYTKCHLQRNTNITILDGELRTYGTITWQSTVMGVGRGGQGGFATPGFWNFTFSY